MDAVAVAEPGAVSAEDARAYAGQWVAIKAGRVIFGDKEAVVVKDWIERGRQPVDLMTKLPREGAPKRWAR